eukprot:CAMPEP_0118638936 /NCGR_PEP_ID=MMETSP0785-20121206/3961_1 /TAXON_ID=91992 /ORGANISM="Bolidomonas pacifica, Strain CCMP 1866" /LENGTH=256 /DNA_ID=CAMNT_0006530241 /DNA_START=156 /DNA_END=923 /DNA_ORIENTATION=-
MESSIGNLFASVTSVYNRAISELPTPAAESVEDAAEMKDFFVLGEFFDAMKARERREREEGITWWSYRSGFSEMRPYGFTSDTGWGCMLRCSQMLLSTMLLRHRTSTSLDSLLTLFADVPGKDHPFGIHGMCKAGLGRDKFPGEWFGPREGCYVIQDLVREGKVGKGVEVIVVGEGCIFVDSVIKEMEKEERGGERESEKPPPPPPMMISDEHDPLYNPPPDMEGEKEWEKSLLLLVPLRLGVNGIDGRYRKNIVE